jgi:hypothetical protein
VVLAKKSRNLHAYRPVEYSKASSNLCACYRDRRPVLVASRDCTLWSADIVDSAASHDRELV